MTALSFWGQRTKTAGKLLGRAVVACTSRAKCTVTGTRGRRPRGDAFRRTSFSIRVTQKVQMALETWKAASTLRNWDREANIPEVHLLQFVLHENLNYLLITIYTCTWLILKAQRKQYWTWISKNWKIVVLKTILNNNHIVKRFTYWYWI